MKTFKQIFAEGEVVQFKSKNPEALSKQHQKHFDAWHKHSVSNEDGGSVTDTEAYESYHNHAEKSGMSPMGLPHFKNMMSDKGIIRQSVGGRKRYVGIKVKDND